ncbi:MAG: hypothetical protein ABSC63_13675 [Candidatus Binataceae bacterium]|jgi:hypothetical protein
MRKRGKKPFAPASALAKRRWQRVGKEKRSELARQLSLARWSQATQEDRDAARERLAEARKKRWPKKGGNTNGKKTRTQ